jgi:hypothetical protein
MLTQGVLNEALRKIGVEYTKSTPAESESSTLNVLRWLNAIPSVKASLLKEAGSHAYL